MFLVSRTAESVAVLNEEICRVLYDKKLSACRFEGYLNVPDWKAVVRTAKSEKNTLPIDIVVSGTRLIRDSVGEVLADARVYLQHPCYEEPDVIYDNPHFLDLSELPASLKPQSGTLPEHSPPLQIDEMIPFEDSVETGISAQDQLRQKMTTVYESLTRSKKLKRIGAGMRIKTPLFP